MATRLQPPISGVVAVVALVVAVVAAKVADETATSPIRPPGLWHSAWVLGVTASFVAYAVTVWLVRRRPRPLLPILAIAIVMQIAPLIGPLLLSQDVYAYWTYGREESVHHANPYSSPPSRFPGDLSFRFVGEELAGKTTIYGPGFTAVSDVHARLAGTSPRRAEILYRVAAAIGVIVLLLVVAFGLQAATFAVTFIGLNPLFALHFAGGGHNDVWMLVLAVGGALLGLGGRQALAGLSWIASASVKASSLTLLPIEAVAACRRNARAGTRFVLWLGAGAVAACGLATVSYGTAWFSSFQRASEQLQRTSSLSSVHRLEQLGLSHTAAKVDLYVLLAGGYAYLLYEAWRGRRRLSLAASLLILTPAWLVPWYGSWPVAFAAVEEDRAAQTIALAVTAYLLSDAVSFQF